MNFTIGYTIEDCIKCGFLFALPDDFILRKRASHDAFYCPSCKNSMYYPQLSDKEKLKRQLKNVQECCVKYEKKTQELEYSKRALKGHITRIKRTA